MPYPEYTNCEAVDLIENEGLGYAVHDYTKGSSFKDPETGRLWDEASAALDAVVAYLRDQTGATL